ncbi:unnamed protein product [Thelazia callipaeda]|uniref:Protein kinase domain-containing protein n=1 Tax=Thelazia callipaeda TaxID=103827 RepID=A0A0N5D0F1_THECL|nr:unnamed protein product [Thelazia callipaeda]
MSTESTERVANGISTDSVSAADSTGTVIESTSRTNSNSGEWFVLMESLLDGLSMACTLGAKGRIFRIDDVMTKLLGYASMKELLGMEITKLIPALQLECDSEVQYVCAIGLRGNAMPAIVKVSIEKDTESLLFSTFIRAFSVLSGVVTLTETGFLQIFNKNFIEALIGKKRSDEESLTDNIHITDIIPKFHTHILTSRLDRTYGEEMLNIFAEFHEYIANCSASSSANNSMKFEFTQLTNNLESLDFIKSKVRSSRSNGSIHSSVSRDQQMCSVRPSTSSHLMVTDEIADNMGEINSLMIDLMDKNNSKELVIREGLFSGFAKHSDGSLIAIYFDIKRLEIAGSAKWAICINYNCTRNLAFSTGMNGQESVQEIIYEDESEDDDYQCDFSVKTRQYNTANSVGHQETECEESVAGEYSKYYNTYHLIGNGAFGSVKLTARKDNGLLAVAKFICKSKVFPESWIPSPKRGNRVVPIELHLLETLSHPNIVKILDVFENDMYYQLVMEKLGCGMDLFEFIDHQPKLDEPLISYIFRQVVNAVSYLHSKNIVHRDVKDENVIIDQNFACKLIDFGSAAYFDQNFVFSTFCGTMEYCSPEVLSGNKYRGPELEMWSMGVLLYTLVFYENPFHNVQETVQADIGFPWEVSEGLFQIITWLLHRNPDLRATIQDLSDHWWIKQAVDVRKYKFQDVLGVKNEQTKFDLHTFRSGLTNYFDHMSSTGASSLVTDTASSGKSESEIDLH